eukprot:CAMPEP_0176399584 /NCGR_PEP_ID=MMETSP0126-20121128/46878_1 /TAXON_ID=141414 ORGANISM="Strombidinopsis acuminatum, Strain SPMC142" /NCGR_SAMPLE_ID=MMETSP0126 /ASSEMBLY_ACC=CAM_ASM_000229 /LENGTH=74 /DNA_ID=CAMNT_0017775255 /DNA_START=409 /DNA_END=636 /DNA_ORIENTATION=-
MVSDRVVLACGYLCLDIAEDTHEWITSAQETETFAEKYLTPEFVGKRVIATILITFYHVEPLKDSEGKTIGTKV